MMIWWSLALLQTYLSLTTALKKQSANLFTTHRQSRLPPPVATSWCVWNLAAGGVSHLLSGQCSPLLRQAWEAL
jgi:hypothetical protein